MVTEFVGA